MVKFDITRQQQKRHDKRVTTETGEMVKMKATAISEQVHRGVWRLLNCCDAAEKDSDGGGGKL